MIIKVPDDTHQSTVNNKTIKTIDLYSAVCYTITEKCYNIHSLRAKAKRLPVKNSKQIKGFHWV